MLKHLTENFNPSNIIIVSGVFILANWLLKTSIGRKSLKDSKPRRNSMHIIYPFLIFTVWILSFGIIFKLLNATVENLADYQQVLLENIIQASISIIFIFIILFSVGRFFARGLKGFGLKFGNIYKDFLYGAATLLAVWPVVLAVLALTIWVLKLFYGSNYQMPAHEELKNIRQFSQVSVYIAIFINGALITPVFEEILFRGLLQTTIRSYTVRPWPAIFVTSIIFAMAHADSAHWPALLFLGIAMGYAYEKSNSLIRSMFIHALFNGLSILAVIFASMQG